MNATHPRDPKCSCAPCQGETPTFAVVVTCVATPCLTCRTRKEPTYFLAPVAHARYARRHKAEIDARGRQKKREPTHRYDVVELRAGDGWPLCPWCGEDELYSMAVPATPDRIAGCYRCGTTFAEASVKLAPL